ncbi:MAG: DUF4835 family protein [Vicingaceae bacterium]|nr:DUF4835 family protein [Vicingaceae bacterium]
MMKNIFKILFLLVLQFSLQSVSAQELNCSVQINSSQIQGSDKSIFDVMQKNIFEFMNTTTWTNNVFQSTERIECSILINVTEQISTGNFKGTIQIQSRRPVFNSSYFSTTLNHLDKDFEFKFNEFDNLEYSKNIFTTNLTSVLAFYANIIIGLDYDSFSQNGGTRYFEEAQRVVTNAQSAQETGWKAFESERNRYWFAQNMLHQNYAPLRTCFYRYHRLGFDIMAENVANGRIEVLKSLMLLEDVFKRRPGNFQLKIFFNSKVDEIVSLFSEGLAKEKTQVTNLTNQIDPTNQSKYEEIAKGK